MRSQQLDITEPHRLSVRKQRAKFPGPKRIVYQGQRPTGKAVKSSTSIEDARSLGMGAGKLDRRPNPFTSRAAKEDFGQSAARLPAEPIREFAC